MQRGSTASSDTEATRSDCTFCQRNGIANYILKETPTFRIVTDHAPLLEGHLLIMPREHYTCYGDVPPQLDEELFALKREVQQFLARFYAPVIFWEHGIFRQTVFHAHLHCFPFGNIKYNLAENLHEFIVTSQDDIRSWHAAHGHYFYLEDSHNAVLFAPDMDRYLRIIQEVLWAGTVSRNGHKTWRSPQQRQEEGKLLIKATAARWRAFQEQGVHDAH
ncbi:MAG: HIT family protein [Chloroflexi bacterium]|nr:HIT family protein [Chloroflexota bacterium]